MTKETPPSEQKPTHDWDIVPPEKLSPTLRTCRTGRIIKRRRGRKCVSERLKLIIGVGVVLPPGDSVDAARREATDYNSEEPNKCGGDRRVYT
jgi:hypothetical protein